MSDEKTVGIPEESTDGFDWKSPELFDNEDFATEFEQSEDQKTEGEAVEEEEQEEQEDEIIPDDDVDPRFEDLPKDEKFRRESQKWKDQFYSLQGKYDATEERLKNLEAGKAATSQMAAEPDIEDVVRENWGDDPALMKLAKGYKELQKQVAQKQQYESKVISTTVCNTIEDFCVANREFLDNSDIGALFVDEMNDRLPQGDFGALVKAAQSGQTFDPEFAGVLKAKMEKAFAVATGKGLVDTVRQNKSKQRKNQRAKTPSSGIQPAGEAVKTAPATEMSYAESLRAARYRG